MFFHCIPFFFAIFYSQVFCLMTGRVFSPTRLVLHVCIYRMNVCGVCLSFLGAEWVLFCTIFISRICIVKMCNSLVVTLYTLHTLSQHNFSQVWAFAVVLFISYLNPVLFRKHWYTFTTHTRSDFFMLSCFRGNILVFTMHVRVSVCVRVSAACLINMYAEFLFKYVT